MALQVWLPLNGSIENQGLAGQYQFINGNPSAITVNNAGKIGKCYDFSATTGYGIYFSTNSDVFMNTYINNHSWTIATWVKTTQSGNSGSISLTYGLRLFLGSNFYINLYNSSRSMSCVGTRGINDGIWHHVVATYNVNTNLISLYLDGILNKTNSYTSGYTYASSWTNGIYIGRDLNDSAASYFFQGSLNDVRIYDHCLSPKEVSELAKGLVLHYKLSDPYVEKTTNLGKTSATYSNFSNGQMVNCGAWGGDAGTCTFYHSGGYNNYPYKVYHKTATGGGGIYYKTVDDIIIESGKTYTVSVYVKASRNFSDSHYSFNINRGSDNYYITSGSSIVYTTEWTRKSWTFTATSAQAGTYGEMSIIYDDSVADYYVYYSGFQIEEKDHATPYTPSTRNETTVYDSSGYNYNGTIVGNLSVVDSDAKYGHAIYLDGTGPYIDSNTNLPFIGNNCPFTVSIWVYCDDWAAATATAAKYIIQQYNATTGGFRIYSAAEANRYRMYWVNIDGTAQAAYFSAAGAFSGWEFLTVTYDGSVMKVYLNGNFVTSKTQTYKNTESSRTLLIGNGAATVPGKYSDFRVYATALSAAAVKELYETSGSVDNMGNVFAREVRE